MMDAFRPDLPNTAEGKIRTWHRSALYQFPRHLCGGDIPTLTNCTVQPLLCYRRLVCETVRTEYGTPFCSAALMGNEEFC